jgi:hypothetical protein
MAIFFGKIYTMKKNKILIVIFGALFVSYFSNPDIFDYSHFIRTKYEEKSSGEKNWFAFYLFNSTPRPSGSQIIDNSNERLNENMQIAIYSKQNNFKFFSIFSTTFPFATSGLPEEKNYVDYKFLGVCGFFINLEDNFGLLEKSLAPQIEIVIPNKIKEN